MKCCWKNKWNVIEEQMKWNVKDNKQKWNVIDNKWKVLKEHNDRSEMLITNEMLLKWNVIDNMKSY